MNKAVVTLLIRSLRGGQATIAHYLYVLYYYIIAVTACKEKVKPQMGLAARKFGRRCGERSAAQISHHKVPA